MQNKFHPEAKLTAAGFSEGMNSEEGFMWSRVGSGIQVSELYSLCPWPIEKSQEVLDSLIKKQCLSIETKAAPAKPKEDKNQKVSPPPSENKLRPEVQKAIQEQLDMDRLDPEARDLDEGFRKDILLNFLQYPEMNEFQILNVRMQASDQEVKAAYLTLSKTFHPDRFFRKKMGVYSKHLNFIFTKIQQSYERIKNQHDREAIARQIKAKDRPAAAKTDAASAVKKVKKLDPALEKIGKAEQFYKLGLEAKSESKWLEAANHFLMASQLNPEKLAYQKAHQDVEPYVMRERSVEMLKSANNALEFGMAEDAMLYAEQALRANPDLHEAGVVVGKCILDLGLSDRISDAFQILRKAKANLPKDPDACVQLGRYYQATGDDEKAIAEFQEALRRDPNCTRAKKLLGKTK